MSVLAIARNIGACRLQVPDERGFSPGGHQRHYGGFCRDCIELSPERRESLAMIFERKLGRSTTAASRIRSFGDASSLGRDSAQSVLTLQYDDDFRLLGFVRHQAGKLCVTPIRDIHHSPGRHGCLGVVIRLYDIQSITVEEERVIAEQFVQFRN
jgi:hypothetical protein